MRSFSFYPQTSDVVIAHSLVSGTMLISTKSLTSSKSVAQFEIGLLKN
jgi:hypothetical protein